MIREREIKLIALENIKVRENVRSSANKENLQELAGSIREQGLLQPVTLLPADDGQYSILMGHRRVQAYQLLAAERPEQYTHIPAIIGQALDDDQIKEIQLVENLQRENLSARDVAESLRYFKGKGMSLKEIAQRLGKSLGYVKNLSSTIKTIDQDQELVALVDGYENITITDIQEVARLPIRPRMRLLKARASGEIATVRELREAAAACKAQADAEDSSPDPSSTDKRKTHSPAERIRVDAASIVFMPQRVVLAELSADQKTALRQRLGQALDALGV